MGEEMNIIDPTLKLLDYKYPDCIMEIYEKGKKIAETETSRFSDHALNTIIMLHMEQGREIRFRLE